MMFRLGIGRFSLVTAAAAAGATSLMLQNHREVFAGSSPLDYPPTKQVRFDNGDVMNRKFTLFQYHSCPFCCKVRAFLDYNGINYDIVEVNSVFRTQVKWSDYKKVPIVLVEEAEKPGEFTQVNDSSVIISAIETVMKCAEGDDVNKNFDKVISYYPSMEMEDPVTKKKKVEFPNRYNIMYGIEQPKEVYDRRKLEQKWRRWVDEDFVHTLAPNIYRTPSEALAAFEYVSEVGGWEEIFPTWQRLTVIYVGAVAMYVLGKVIARRHNLNPDVRESLYDGCRVWLRALGKKPFMGGKNPDLSDLAVFGVLSSIAGCEAFHDTMREVPKMAVWYNRVQAAVRDSRGKV